MTERESEVVLQMGEKWREQARETVERRMETRLADFTGPSQGLLVRKIGKATTDYH